MNPATQFCDVTESDMDPAEVPIVLCRVLLDRETVDRIKLLDWVKPPESHPVWGLMLLDPHGPTFS